MPIEITYAGGHYYAGREPIALINSATDPVMLCTDTRNLYIAQKDWQKLGEQDSIIAELLPEPVCPECSDLGIKGGCATSGRFRRDPAAATSAGAVESVRCSCGSR